MASCSGDFSPLTSSVIENPELKLLKSIFNRSCNLLELSKKLKEGKADLEEKVARLGKFVFLAEGYKLLPSFQPLVELLPAMHSTTRIKTPSLMANYESSLLHISELQKKNAELFNLYLQTVEKPAPFIISSLESVERKAADNGDCDEGIAPTISEEQYSIDALCSHPIPDKIVKSTEKPSSFYSRVESTWERITGEKAPMSGQKLFEMEPSHVAVQRAIDEEIVKIFVDYMLQYISVYQPKDKDQLLPIQEIYQWLPHKFQHELQLSGGLEEENPFAKIDCFFQALRTYRCYFALPRCEGDVRGSLFRIKDQEGRVRAHILGSIHYINPKLLRFRAEVRKAFYIASTLMVEFNETKGLTIDAFHRKWATTQIDPDTKKYLTFMDGRFMYAALEREKRVIGLEHHDDVHAYRNSHFISEETDSLPELDSSLLFNGDFEGYSEEVRSYYSKLIQPRFFETFIKLAVVERNGTQLKTIEHFFEKYPAEMAFITVGAAHLVDFPNADGLLTLLRKKRYHVEQI